jgi:hypothetical protein
MVSPSLRLLRSLRRAAAALPVALALCSGAMADDRRPLGSADITKRIVGVLMLWEATDGPQHGDIIFAEDGTVTMTTTIPGLPKDLGRWRVDRGQVCTTWDQARGGAEKCYTLEETEPDVFRTSGGNLFRIKQPYV